MQQQQPPSRYKIPFWEQVAIARHLTKLPALTIMVFLRNDIGYRFLNTVHLALICGSLVVVSIFLVATGASEQDRVGDLFIFALLAFLFGGFQQAKRFHEHKRGILQHSFYIGTSGFSKGRLTPAFLRRERRCERFVEPGIVIFIAFHYLPISPILCLWVIFAALCLCHFEGRIRRRELNERLDMLDGLVESEVKTKEVDTFEPPPKAQPKPKKRTTTGVPTGIGPDIAKQIRRRKRQAFSFWR